VRTKIPYYSAEYDRIKAEIENDKNRKTNKGEVFFRSLKMEFLEKKNTERCYSISVGCTSLTTVEFPSIHTHGIRSLR